MTPLRHQRIIANAGSGKTYRLTSRFIELLARGVPAEKIIALTFTRKAAGEFLDAIFERLLKAASSETESRLLAGAIGFPALHRADFHRLLEDMVRKLPQLALGTLDGFFARVVRVFPLECGLAGEITVLDPQFLDVTRRSVLAAVFRAHAGNDRSFAELLELLRQESRNRQSRSVIETVDRQIAALHEKYLQTPANHVWGDPGTSGAADRPSRTPATSPPGWSFSRMNSRKSIPIWRTNTGRAGASCLRRSPA